MKIFRRRPQTPPAKPAPLAHFRELYAEEVRVLQSSGASKGTKPARFDQIPSVPLYLLAVKFGGGNQKYEKVDGLDNWRHGIAWSDLYAAMMRHAVQFWNGEDIDPDSGMPHLMAVAWHAMVLTEFGTRPETAAFDDRQDAR